MGGAIKLGIAAGVGYTIGGKLGLYASRGMAGVDADVDTRTGYKWGGRIITFLGVAYLLGKV